VADDLAERLPDGLLVVRDGVIVLANARAQALLGRGALQGQRVDDRLVLRNDAGLRVDFPDVPMQVGHRYAEHVLHLDGPDGSRPLAISGRWSDGELVLTLRSAARREAAVRSQADIVATVAHEIRSPLTSVKGFTRTLLSRWDRFSDEQKHTMLATIEADADRVTRLLTDLLDVARIDAGRVKLRRTEVDPVGLVRSVAEKARIRSPDREIDVEVHDEIPSILADADKVEQVITNLVDNAIQHAPGSPVRCTLVRQTEGIRITVADEGPGVAPDVAPVLFTKFTRGRSDSRAGTGLGLFVSKGLVEAHGGRIWFDRATDVGATVHVLLPVGQP
jgi:signal transduction histidine kinase